MAGTINLALSQQFNAQGEPLSGGQLFFYQAATTTPTPAFIDTDLLQPFPNPIVLDASGRVPMFYLRANEAEGNPSGQIKIRLEDKLGQVQIAADNLLVIGSAGGTTAGTGGPNPTTLHQVGDIKGRFGTGIHTGWLQCNGTTVGDTFSGANHADTTEFAALFKYLHTTPLKLFTSTGGAATKTNPTNDFNNHFRMALPDLRGRTIAGLDDMGAAAAGVLTSSSVGFGKPTTGATALGNSSGGQSVNLVTGNLPIHSHTLARAPQTALTSRKQSVNHHHTVSSTGSADSRSVEHAHRPPGLNTISGIASGGGLTVVTGYSGGLDGNAITSGMITTGGQNMSPSHVHGVSVAGTTSNQLNTAPATGVDHTHIVDLTGLTGDTGSGSDFVNCQPTLLLTFYIKT